MGICNSPWREVEGKAQVLLLCSVLPEVWVFISGLCGVDWDRSVTQRHRGEVFYTMLLAGGVPAGRFEGWARKRPLEPIRAERVMRARGVKEFITAVATGTCRQRGAGSEDV